MVKAKQILKSASSNWLSYAVSVVVAFLLSPFVVHHLGNLAYGVWSLIVSLISFMGLLDFGLRGAVTRFVSKHHAQQDHEAASRAVSAAFWLRLWIGLGVIAVSVVISFLLTRFVVIPQELQFPAKVAVLVAGTSFAVSLTFGVFGGVLAALHRFDILSSLTIAQTLCRAAGIVWLLRSGHGIVSLALWELTVIVAVNALLTGVCFRLYRGLRLIFRRPDSDLLRSIWQYSSYIFFINVCYQVIAYSDNLVVASFISVAAVTFYTIAGSLIDYLRQLVSALTMTFMPLASGYEAQNKDDQLRNLLVQGTRAALCVALPVELALYFRGSTFINLWMGNAYGHTSGVILQILVGAQFFTIANATSGNIAYGTAKHRPVAIWVAVEAVLNLGLSIFLARRIGVYGVAWGTLIATLGTQLIFWPVYICRIVKMPLFTYLWQSWIRTGLAAIPFGIACYFTDHRWQPVNLAQFFLQIIAILPLFLISVALLFGNELFPKLRERLAGPRTLDQNSGR
ncbi:MAG TPA: oligosaccharide flippase family protein [Alphaproteobacteria bacterium]|nr:oligosaccharide flippase family protein [Alphaproteobacteria bacterium]